jgi:hypothetical protein
VLRSTIRYTLKVAISYINILLVVAMVNTPNVAISYINIFLVVAMVNINIVIVRAII